MLSTKDSIQIKRHTQKQSEGWKKIFHVNGNGKKIVGVAILRQK